MSNLRILAALMLAAVALSGCETGTPAQAAESAVADLGPGPYDDIWYLHPGDQSGFSVWVGPRVVVQPGRTMRFVTLAGFLPGTEHPLTNLRATVDVESSRTVENTDPDGLYSIRISPNPTLTWNDVNARDQLQVEFTGFY